MIFSKTLEQVSILLIFIFIGYFLRKKEVITENGKKVLAGLDGTNGAKMCFISYVLALATLPVVFEVIKILA